MLRPLKKITHWYQQAKRLVQEEMKDPARQSVSPIARINVPDPKQVERSE